MSNAIALYRVSTYRQSIEGHSLDAQEERVRKAAEFLQANIVQEWRIDASSKVGKNLGRKDLREALQYCTSHKQVKYFLIDEVDRFMRSIKEYYWYQVEFEKLGVRLIFASQPELNEEGQFAKLRELLAIYEAESSNAERSRKTLDKMKARVAAGYYPFYPHQGYKSTPEADGLHVPDEPRFTMLQTVLQAIAAYEMTPKEALDWLHAHGYITPKGGRKLDMGHFSEILKSSYYAGELRIKDWPVNPQGLHQPMITMAEYETNLAIITGRKTRTKLKNNPDFPLNLAYHEPCTDTDGKLTGINHTNGKGWYRKEYVCRTCKKRVPQALVHEHLNHTLERLKPSERGLEALKSALTTVWNRKEAYRVDQLKQLQQRLQERQDTKGKLITSLSSNPEFSEDFKEEISRIKAEIVELERQIAIVNSVDKEFEEFKTFALDYSEDLRSQWWRLSPDKLRECKQLLFNDEISVGQDGKVYTPKISAIYTLLNANDGSKAAENANMVELVGTAPTSVGV